MGAIYPWQETQWQQLISRYRAQRLPHALLLSGCKDLGKRFFANALAALIICDQPTDTPCGSCHGCQLLAAGTHPDFLLIEPIADSRIIKIEQIRDLLEVLGQTPQCAGHQVVIVEPAEALNRSAANALLKTLEEPSGQIIFILISHQPSTIPATIRSRCQIVKFAVPPYAQGAAWLADELPDYPARETLLKIADGIPLRAKSLGMEKGLTKQEEIVSHFLALHEGSLDPLAMAQLCNEQAFGELLNCLGTVTLDLIRLQLDARAPLKWSQYHEKLFIISQQVTAFRLFDFLDRLMTAKRYEEENLNLNWQLLLEEIFTGLKN